MAARMQVSLTVFTIAAGIFFSNVSFASHGFLATHYPGDYVRLMPAAQVNFLAAPAKTQVNYYGGPVISNAKVVAVFWGNNVDTTTTAGIGGFFSAVTNSTYMDWIDEYNTLGKAMDGRQGTNQHLGRGSYVGAITISPAITSGTVTDDQIQAELQKQITAGVLPKPDDNTLYMTYFPPNLNITAFGAASCQQFCAYHGFNGTPTTAHFYYGVMPDISGACASGCGFAMTQFDSLTSISSHEYMEAITDPYPTPGSNPAYPQAWNDSQGNEVGDLCTGNGNPGGDNTLHTATVDYTVQAIFDNSIAGCTNKTWTSP